MVKNTEFPILNVTDTTSCLYINRYMVKIENFDDRFRHMRHSDIEKLFILCLIWDNMPKWFNVHSGSIWGSLWFIVWSDKFVIWREFAQMVCSEKLLWYSSIDDHSFYFNHAKKQYARLYFYHRYTCDKLCS